MASIGMQTGVNFNPILIATHPLPCSWALIKPSAGPLTHLNNTRHLPSPTVTDGLTPSVERNVEGDGDTRWFDEILLNKKLGHCRGTGVVQRINGEWKLAHYSLTLLIPNDIAAAVGVSTQEADGLIEP
jgi:hypothetical protein